jgi:hypothetical protein
MCYSKNKAYESFKIKLKKKNENETKTNRMQGKIIAKSTLKSNNDAEKIIRKKEKISSYNYRYQS